MKRTITNWIKMISDPGPPCGPPCDPSSERGRSARERSARGRSDGADAGFAPGQNDEAGCDPAPIPIDDALDLHSIAPRDVPVVVEEYLWEASAAGFAEVRIIHGKGIGVQRRRVASVLETHPVVVSYQLATADRGHYGATIARLRTDIERPPE